jgi:hypothetical protein
MVTVLSLMNPVHTLMPCFLKIQLNVILSSAPKSFRLHILKYFKYNRDIIKTLREEHTRVYPKVSGLAAWSENCEWYSSLPLGAVE